MSSVRRARPYLLLLLVSVIGVCSNPWVNPFATEDEEPTPAFVWAGEEADGQEPGVGEIVTNSPAPPEESADPSAPASPEADTDPTTEPEGSSGEPADPSPGTGADPGTPEEDQATSSPADTIPVGSYEGTMEDGYPSYWAARIGKPGLLEDGKVWENAVSLTVAEDGTVTGTMSYSFVSQEYVGEGGGCLEHWELEVDGAFGGDLIASQGTLDLAGNQTHAYYAVCDEGNFPTVDTREYEREVGIQVAGEEMEGRVVFPDDPDDQLEWTFTATRE